MRDAVLYVIVPCYNEGGLLYDTSDKLSDKLDKLISGEYISSESRVLFVDDGSEDKSWEIIVELHKKNSRICGISLAHNRGHQNALLAGLMTARTLSDVTITIDADLQQDIEAVDRFLDEYYKGNDIVYGIRNDRASDGFMKKATAGSYYRLMRLSGADIYDNAADYRLMSRKAIDALSEYGEVNLFLRGMAADIGLKHSKVYFDVSPRTEGKSKYTPVKMIRLAVNGITSFTAFPIHLVAGTGVLCFIVSIIMIILVFIDRAKGNTVPGYSTILISLWLIGGMILLGLGIVGEYVGQTYMESKHRPRYFIKDRCMDDTEKRQYEDLL